MKKLFYLLGIALVMSSCASLTKTQIKSVNNFGQTTTNFSAYPSKIMTELAEIRFDRGLFYTNALISTDGHIKELNEIYKEKEFDYALSKKIDITYKIIDKYSQSLVLLLSDKHVLNIEEQSNSFGVDIDKLIATYNSIEGASKIPSGIGAAVGELVVLGGKQFIRTKQAKEIKKFVSQADTLIETTTSNLLKHLQSDSLQSLIANEERGLSNNYLKFLNKRKNDKSLVTIENDREYIRLKTRIDGVKKLKKQSIAATKRLRTAHKRLLKEIQEKKKLKQSAKELIELFEEVKGLKETIEKIETNKK